MYKHEIPQVDLEVRNSRVEISTSAFEPRHFNPGIHRRLRASDLKVRTRSTRFRLRGCKSQHRGSRSRRFELLGFATRFRARGTRFQLRVSDFGRNVHLNIRRFYLEISCSMLKVAASTLLRTRGPSFCPRTADLDASILMFKGTTLYPKLKVVNARRS